MSTFTHTGIWDAHSRQSSALRFLEKYYTITATLNISQIPYATFYSPTAIFRDTTSTVYIGGERIWSFLKHVFTPFSIIQNDIVEARVVQDKEGREVAYMELVTRFWFKGEEDELVVPRFFVWTIGPEAMKGQGTDGLQIEEVKAFWDTGVIGRFLSERRKDAAKRKIEEG
jgi:hypothetical protein